MKYVLNFVVKTRSKTLFFRREVIIMSRKTTYFLIAGYALCVVLFTVVLVVDTRIHIYRTAIIAADVVCIICNLVPLVAVICIQRIFASIDENDYHTHSLLFRKQNLIQCICLVIEVIIFAIRALTVLAGIMDI